MPASLMGRSANWGSWRFSSGLRTAPQGRSLAWPWAKASSAVMVAAKAPSTSKMCFSSASRTEPFSQRSSSRSAAIPFDDSHDTIDAHRWRVRAGRMRLA
jgi:hypothetical protein